MGVVNAPSGAGGVAHTLPQFGIDAGERQRLAVKVSLQGTAIRLGNEGVHAHQHLPGLDRLALAMPDSAGCTIFR